MSQSTFSLSKPSHLSPRNYEELLSQAHLWEQNGEHTHAIDVYIQLNTKNCPDNRILQESWEKVSIFTGL